jgi:signal transduction histidine kinase
MTQAVVVTDAHGRVVRANPRWYALVGRAEAEALGRPLPEAPADQLVTRAPVPGPDGTPRWWVTTYLDFTEGRKLERAAAFKNDLMALVSHEMSQPLSSSASLAELLADSWEQLADDTRRDLTLKIHRNTRRLVGMVTDMLLLFQLDAGTVTARRTPVPVREVVEQVGAEHEPVVRIDPALSALVDRNHLEQILGQLLGNAVAYGAPPIEVAAGQDVEGVVITVTDAGGGIPEDIRPQLFERAVRPKATGAGSGRGRGLGLFIARHLTEINGGRIGYEPVQPHGARLVVRLAPAT